MIPHRLIIALLPFVALAALIPMWSVVDPSDLAMTPRFMAGMVLPAVLLIYGASWVRPSLTAPIMGVFLLIGLAVLAPTFWGFITIVSNETDGFVQLTAQLVVPVIVFAAVATLARGEFS